MKFLSAVPRGAVLNQSVHLDSVNMTVLECKQVPPQQHIASVKRPLRWEWPLRASFAFWDIVGEKEKKKILIILSHISCQKDKHVETPECQTLWQSYKSVTIKKIQLCFSFSLTLFVNDFVFSIEGKQMSRAAAGHRSRPFPRAWLQNSCLCVFIIISQNMRTYCSSTCWF